MRGRASVTGRSERGSALAVVVLLVLFSTLGALVALSYADSAYQRMTGETKVERAGLIAESGLSFYVEQWRRSATFLDSSNGVYPTTTALSNTNLQKAVTCSAGTFTLIEIDRVTLGAGGSSEGRVVTVRGDYDGVRYTVRALLAPNLNSPIQGVGTTSNQNWTGSARFDSTGADAGTIFGNNNLNVQAGVVITGNAKFNQAVSNSGIINGTVTTGVADVTFPNQSTVINNATNAVAAKQNQSGVWTNATTAILNAAVASGGVKPTMMERIPASAGSMASPWSSTNQMSMSHWAIQGGELSLPAGNYAFGRLWLDGTVLTIKAPAGGGELVLPDVFLTNGARLILDTTDGPFRVVSGTNNAFSGSISSASGKQRYNAATNAFVATTTAKIKMTGDTAVWAGSGGNIGGSVKKQSGTGSGYDDWLIRDDSVFATVTGNSANKGGELYMKSSLDIVLTDGARVVAGVPAGQLADLKNKATSIATIDTYEHHAMGFLVWSGGGDLPRFDVSAGQGASGAASRFVGLTYGQFEGNIGANGWMEGAFVGKDLDIAGTLLYDSALLALVSSGDANSQHVVVRARVH